MRRLFALVSSLACVLLLALALPCGLTAQGTPPGLRGTVQPMSGTPSYGVSVTPDGGWEPDRAANSGPYTVTFTATNTGLNPQTFGFECWGTGGIDCSSVSPTSKRLTHGQSQNLTVTYSVGASGGQIRVSAEGTSYDEGYKDVATPPNLALVLPTPSGSSATVHTRQPLVRATYVSTDALIDTTSLIVRWASETVTALTRRNAQLVEWEVDASRQLTPGVAKDLYIKVCNTHGGCSEHTWSVTLDNSGAPIVSFTGMPLEALGRQFSAPFGPGLAVSGAEVEAGFTVPAYLAMSAPHATGLVYSTRQSYPRALVNADIELTWPTGTPTRIRALLTEAGVLLDTFNVASPTCSASSGRRCRITLQGDFSGSTYSRATRKWLKVEVQVTSGATMHSTTDSVEAVLVDRRASPYGSGWFVSGVVRLDSAGTDMILVGSSGTAAIYRGANGQYLSPPGDFSVLVWTGSQWELRFRDGSKLVFDAQGRHTRSVDRHANVTTISYGGTDLVSSIADPLNKAFTFAYDSSLGFPRVTITHPGSLRTSTISINASHQLTYDSLASDPSRPAVSSYTYTTYGGYYTLVLATTSDALGQTTSVSYDARRRPTQATLPAVLPDTGSTALSPVITYRAQELRGLDTLLSADSVFVRVRDPRGNWTASALTRWGAPSRTWDALGTTACAAYTPEGSLAWSEAKVADSTRTYFTYDSYGRLARSFRLRSASDTVRLDSLVYDASHRVIKAVNPWGQRDTQIYNGYGDVMTQIRFTGAGSGDTTRYTYNANGLVASVRAPTQTGSTQYSYDGNWNVYEEQNAAGVMMARHFPDAHGRDTTVVRLLTVRLGEPNNVVQWRRSRTWYTALNEVTRSRLERTDDCTAPCTPPSWPTDSDTSRWQQVEHYFDRLGRDTARVNTYGKRTRYAYDALGRLRRRWPYGDSVAVVDSIRYDLAGNVRFQFTRRGYQIEHRYDSRNRDTLTAVPGVGNIRRTFGGPADQLTRLWIASYVDSIGGVHPEVSWVYSQAGLLLSDTAQGNRSTSYLADRYGRDTVVTDVQGTTRLAYHATRGVVDSIVTPYADTLTYAIDAWGRAVGPRAANGTDPDFAVTQTWDDVGKLVRLTTTQPDAVTVGDWEVDGEMPDLDLHATWSDALGVAQDTLGHDAWRRVTTVQYLRNGGQIAAETFSFTRDGNIRLSGESRTYNLATGRMTERAGGSYGYDRAGNLVSWTPSGGSTWTYTYDPLDRLVAVRQGGTVVARYAYDVLGRRIVKRVYGGANAGYLRMIYAGDAVAAEADSGGTLTMGYTWGLGTDDLVAVHRYSDSGHWYVVQDQLRSVRGLTRRDGTWVVSWRYRIYGAGLDSLGAAPFALRYRWTGREYDAETGFYYFRARYYDPGSERFVQEDPLGYAGGATLYGYADGSPVVARDPSGMAATPQYPDACLDQGGTCGATEADDLFGDWDWGGGGGGGDWVNDLDSWLAFNAAEYVMMLDYRYYTDRFEAMKQSGYLDRLRSVFGDGVDPAKVDPLNSDDFAAVQRGITEIYGHGGPPVGAENAGVAQGLANLLGTGRVAYYASPDGIGSSTWRWKGQAGPMIFLHYQWRYGGRPAGTLAHEWYHIHTGTDREGPAVEGCRGVLGAAARC